MQELYDIACETNLMLAPANSPREIYASAQLAARDFFGPVDDVERFPRSFVVVRSADGEAAPVRPARACGGVDRDVVHRERFAGDRVSGRQGVGRRAASSSSARARPGRSRRATSPRTVRPSCAIESRTRPDFLRAMALAGPDNPHGLEGSPMYDGLNVGKRTSRST